ncbi:MAG: glycosyltransferase family 4 protein [Alphaproteobacteria bacterium]|nr:glycosyltransferase family 4 protein [Alphaproteobacteria bacterium]
MIVHVVRQFPPSRGGIEDCVHNLCRSQRSHYELDARVITLNRLFQEPGRLLPCEAHEDDIPIQRISYRGSSRYPLAPSVLWYIRDADLVHVHGIDFFFDYLAWTRAYHQKPIVASTHGGFFHTSFAAAFKNLYFNTVTRLSSRWYDAVVAVSTPDYDIFNRLISKHLLLIENGINHLKFADAASLSHRRVLMYFGRFAPHKGITKLFSLLAQLSPTWHLVLAGSPWGMEIATLHAAATQCGVKDRVEFLLQPDDAALREAMGRASYFVSASEFEGFGLTAVEAMSAGLVPVLSAIPPFRKLVDSTGVGVVFDPAEPEGAARCLERWSRCSPAEQYAARQNAIAAAMPYDWRSRAGAYVDLYRSVLADRKAVPA